MSKKEKPSFLRPLLLFQHTAKSDATVLNHPAIRRFLESPSRSSSPLNQGSETPSIPPSESESLSQHGEGAERDRERASWREGGSRNERRPGRNTGKVGWSRRLMGGGSSDPFEKYFRSRITLVCVDDLVIVEVSRVEHLSRTSVLRCRTRLAFRRRRSLRRRGRPTTTPVATRPPGCL